MTIQVVNKSDNPLPRYKTAGSAGMDLHANLKDKDGNETPVMIHSMQRLLIPTGLFVAIPEGFEMQIRPRSGAALKQGITVLNSPGTIDSDYRGDVGVILINMSSVGVLINHGDRIAQAVFAKVEKARWDVVESLEDTERGEGGFGHTGK